MEPRFKIDISQISKSDTPDLSDSPKVYFKKAEKFAFQHYEKEIKNIWGTKFEEITPEFFFHECIWVIHATGFSASAVGKFIHRVIEAYGDFRVLAEEDFEKAFSRIRKVCNNKQKAASIFEIAEILSTIKDWEAWKNENINDVDKLQKLPYIGPVTKYHLGRNIGLLDSVKPDLHFVRMAKHWGFENSLKMCQHLQEGTNYPLGIIDLILWYSASTFGTISIKQDGDRLSSMRVKVRMSYSIKSKYIDVTDSYFFVHHMNLLNMKFNAFKTFNTLNTSDTFNTNTIDTSNPRLTKCVLRCIEKHVKTLV